MVDHGKPVGDHERSMGDHGKPWAATNGPWATTGSLWAATNGPWAATGSLWAATNGPMGDPLAGKSGQKPWIIAIFCRQTAVLSQNRTFPPSRPDPGRSGVIPPSETMKPIPKKLRTKAERLLATTPRAVAKMPVGDVQKLVHELRGPPDRVGDAE